jgi:hypothetical protein
VAVVETLQAASKMLCKEQKSPELPARLQVASSRAFTKNSKSVPAFICFLLVKDHKSDKKKASIDESLLGSENSLTPSNGFK